MEKGRKIGSLEFVIILIIIFLVAVIGYFFWYLPAQDKITVNVYKIAMNSARTAAEICLQSGGKIIAEKPGEPLCNPNYGNYPAITDDCNPSKPYFKIKASKDGKWLLTNYDNSGNFWDCKGCRLECTAEKCGFIEKEKGDCT